MSANDPREAASADESATGGGGPETPAAKLAKLKAELEKAQSDSEKLEEQSATLQGTIAELNKGVAELTKAVAEIDQRSKAWEKALQTLNQRRGEEEKYYKLKRPMLEATVSEKDKEFVVKQRKEGEAAKAVAALKDRVGKLEGQEAAQSQKLAVASAAAEQAQRRFDELAGLAQTNDKRLKELATLHADAEKEDAKNNVTRMFFLILEMEDEFKKLDLPTVKEYTDRVTEAQAAAESAKAAEKSAKVALAQTQSDLKNTRKELAAAEADRRKKTLEAIPADAEAAVPS
jgi:chromosome segregation ATPase